uniref:G_PROTEIN_RECEP_F1_2 domain-containing protein n=2 Tax=Caenorhabditis tropicalis TaxID=1561998 RepID=A0A1I7UJA3_9PELO
METTTNFFDHATYLFPNSDESSRIRYYQIMLTLEKFARPSLQFQYYLSFFGVFLTLIHLVILTRKAMMMSSISSIMIGLGMCDLIAMIATILCSRMFFDEEGTDCCLNIPLNSIYTVYSQKRSSLYTDNDEVFGKTYMFLNGVVSKIIPCVLLPILTILLVLELQKAEAIRKSSNFSKRAGSEKTTGLVIFMAISFFILELPIGISWVFQVAYTDFGFLYLATYISHMERATSVNSTQLSRIGK